MLLFLFMGAESKIKILISNRIFPILFINILYFCCFPNRFFTKKHHKNMFCIKNTDSDSLCRVRKTCLFKSKVKKYKKCIFITLLKKQKYHILL